MTDQRSHVTCSSGLVASASAALARY